MKLSSASPILKHGAPPHVGLMAKVLKNCIRVNIGLMAKVLKDCIFWDPFISWKQQILALINSFNILYVYKLGTTDIERERAG